MSLFSDRLKLLRSHNNMSQKALGEKLGLSQQAIAKWETDASAPDIYMLAVLSDLFNVSADYLIGLSDSPGKKDLTPEQREALEKAAAETEGINFTDEQLAAMLPANIREGILALLRLERDKYGNN